LAPFSVGSPLGDGSTLLLNEPVEKFILIISVMKIFDDKRATSTLRPLFPIFGSAAALTHRNHLSPYN
jgi:hypothetical protein